MVAYAVVAGPVVVAIDPIFTFFKVTLLYDQLLGKELRISYSWEITAQEMFFCLYCP